MDGYSRLEEGLRRVLRGKMTLKLMVGLSVLVFVNQRTTDMLIYGVRNDTVYSEREEPLYSITKSNELMKIGIIVGRLDMEATTHHPPGEWVLLHSIRLNEKMENTVGSYGGHNLTVMMRTRHW